MVLDERSAAPVETTYGALREEVGRLRAGLAADGVRPGDQEKDIQQLTRDEFLLLKWPMPVTLNCPQLAYPSCIGEPAAYYAGNEPELDDTLLVKRYGKRNADDRLGKTSAQERKAGGKKHPGGKDKNS